MAIAGPGRSRAEQVSSICARARSIPRVGVGSRTSVGLSSLARSARAEVPARGRCSRTRDAGATTERSRALLLRVAHLFAITNAVKHGPATIVNIELGEDGGALELVITNDGKSSPDPASFTRGRGLRIMEYRAKTIGAVLAIEANSRGGLCIRCTLPRA